jgi:hypothetical protein
MRGEREQDQTDPRLFPDGTCVVSKLTRGYFRNKGTPSTIYCRFCYFLPFFVFRIKKLQLT